MPHRHDNADDGTGTRHVTELWWDGHRGRAEHLGAGCDLTEAPKLSTVRLVASLTYKPALHIAEIRASGASTRPMSAVEVDEVRVLLDHQASASHAVWLQNSTQTFFDPADVLGEPCIRAWRKLATAISHLTERKALAACLHRNGLSYEEIAAMFQRMTVDGETQIGLAVAMARKPHRKPEEEPPPAVSAAPPEGDPPP